MIVLAGIIVMSELLKEWRDQKICDLIYKLSSVGIDEFVINYLSGSPLWEIRQAVASSPSVNQKTLEKLVIDEDKNVACTAINHAIKKGIPIDKSAYSKEDTLAFNKKTELSIFGEGVTITIYLLSKD